MNKIPIYKHEKSEAGLVDKIQNSNTIAYISLMEPAQDNMQRVIAKCLDDSSKASSFDSDLYFTKSILVSTCWNKNDDVFNPLETWKARHTPSHKPTNLEHNEKEIVGHIVDVWAFDTDFQMISDNCAIDELPNKYHLVTGSVIYKNWSDEGLVDRTEALIKQIESGKKFVSMEVLFTDFDYALQLPDGTIKTTARNNETSWMTKLLRAYGGSGTYEDYKIGRQLKNMTFCGKGFVDKPANPESVIFSFNNSNANTFLSASSNLTSLDSNGVSKDREDDLLTNNLEGDNFMSDTIYKDQAEKLEKVVADLESKLADANDKLAQADVAKYTAKIEELSQQVAAKDEEMASLAGKVDEMTAKLNEVTENLESEKSSKAELQTKLDEIVVAECKANRVSTLVDGGIDKESAVAKVEKFANISDEQFEALAGELIDAAKVKAQATQTSTEGNTDEDTSNDEEQDDNEANANQDTLDSAETDEEADLSVDTSHADNELADLRKELSDSIASCLGYKVNSVNDGEDE